MLGSAWLLLTFLILIAAVILKQAPLLIVAVLFFLTSGIARLWSRYSLQRLDFKRKLSSNRVFFGENINFEITITNRKFIPLPWIHIQEEIPVEVTFLNGKTSTSHKVNRAILSNFLSMGWYHRLTRRYHLQCLKRGIFEFGPVAISSGDPFGFFRNRTELEQQDRLLVFPRIMPLEDLGIPSRHPFGDLRVRRHIFEDPVQVMTTRDYVPGDPMKHIHWKSSARLQRLQSRVFEHTTTMDMAIFLDTRTVADALYWSLISPDYLETGVLVAASLANYASENGFKTGFYANEYYWYSDRLIKLPPSNHPDQLKEVLEALAQVRGLSSISAEKMLDREARLISWETTLVLISAVPTSGLISALKRYQRAGRRVALILIGDAGTTAAAAVKGEGIMIYRVSPEIYRKELDSLRLVQEK
ncbi:MAG: DUF58 domain-containing protein [Dehalococcoidales bacterium]|nr:DUF58 domain-containing protein [Dehalococcoidales bacterium]